MGERMCACGCGLTYEQAVQEARSNSGWLSPDQAEDTVRSIQEEFNDA